MRALTSLYRIVVQALAIAAGAILAAIALAIALDVALRTCCTNAIHGLTDMTEHGIAAATFLAAPWVLMKNAHVAVDLVVMLLPTRTRLRLDLVMNVVGAAVSAAFSLVSAAGPDERPCSAARWCAASSSCPNG